VERRCWITSDAASNILPLLRRRTFNCKDSGGRIFITDGLGSLTARGVPPRLRFIHAGELEHHHARCRRRTLKSYRVSAAHDIFAPTRLDFFHGQWKKFFSVPLFIRHVDFDDCVARRRGLGM
jgi:hypothetical protein